MLLTLKLVHYTNDQHYIIFLGNNMSDKFDIYTTMPGETFAGIMARRYGITSPTKIQDTFDATKAIMFNDLVVTNPYSPIRPYVTIVFPDNIEKQKSPLILPSSIQRCANQIKCMPQQDKEVIAQLNTADDVATAEAISEWAAGYGLLGVTGDTITGLSTPLGMAANKATPFIAKIKELDKALVEYRNLSKTVGASRHAAKTKVLNLHKQLNQLFGKEIRGILLKNSSKPGRSILTNSTRMVNVARSGRTAPVLSTAAGIQKVGAFAKYSKHIGRGAVVLDLGVRGLNIYEAHQSGNDWYKELATQSGGLLFSATAAWGLGVLAGTIALGPLGLIIILFVGAAIAIGADYVGRRAGSGIYDFSKTLY